MMPMPSRAASAGPCITTGTPSMANLAGVGPMDAAEDLHQRRLARAVLADEPDDLAGRHVEVHAIERDDAGKSLGDRRHLQ